MRALRVIQEKQATTIRARVREVVSADLGRGDVLRATRSAHRELDEVAMRATAHDKPECAAGCSYCCHVHVDATPAEVDAVAEHLHGASPAFLERLAKHVAIVTAMTNNERWSAKIPCALLGDDGRCTVYDARPLRCRAFHSFSAETCRDAFLGNERTPVTSPALDRACDAAERGFEDALEAHGITTRAVLLEPALLTALRCR